jgi:hypothetical protein
MAAERWLASPYGAPHQIFSPPGSGLLLYRRARGALSMLRTRSLTEAHSKTWHARCLSFRRRHARQNLILRGPRCTSRGRAAGALARAGRRAGMSRERPPNATFRSVHVCALPGLRSTDDRSVVPSKALPDLASVRATNVCGEHASHNLGAENDAPALIGRAARFPRNVEICSMVLPLYLAHLAVVR